MRENHNKNKDGKGTTTCPKCKSKDNYTDIPVEYSSHLVVSESKRVCKDCEFVMDYWFMGVWESEYETDENKDYEN